METLNLLDVESTVKENSTYHLDTLQPWSAIPGFNLSNVSGRGYYSTSFDWPPEGSEASGAIIDFGTIVHTISVKLNDIQLPALDLSGAEQEVSAYLQNGTNSLEVVVTTPYGNGLIPLWSDLRTYGTPPGSD